MLTGAEIGLLATGIAGIIVVILLITGPLKLHPVLALLVSALAIGLVAGESPKDVVTAITDGAGKTFGGTGLIVVLGTVLGTLLAESGGTQKLAEALTRGRSLRSIPWMVSLLSAIVALPLFFEVALAVLLPLLISLAKEVQTRFLDEEGRDASGRKLSPYMLVAVPALASVASLHALLPPHPGPVAAANAVHANIGTTIAFGLPIALVTSVLAGQLFVWPMARRMFPTPPARLIEQFTVKHHQDSGKKLPSVPATVVPVVLPLVFILAPSVTPRFEFSAVIDFIGQPVVALLIAVIVAMITLGWSRGTTGSELKGYFESSIIAVAPILLIIAAGGALGSVMVGAGIGDVIAKAAHSFGLTAVVLAWVIAALIRLAVGSATVAIITAAGIVAPVISSASPAQAALVVLALGTGSVIFPHVNNAGSWYVKESFGMSLGQMFKSFTVIETTISFVGFAIVAALSMIIA
ncbi:gluconate:H+ symporter [Paenarthrobacter sp. NPDC089989]|uniref:GntT/GntP/DsdX family permease n=1 Tax=unclassified Paenarthrobacter TaxID=2634190 RepID=UPI00382FDD53